MPVLLGYWKVRGLAQPIRYILEYAGIEYKEKFYEFGPAPEYNKDSWFKEKHNLGLSFPNVPYLIDGDVKLTQSNVILRYLAGKANLLGTNDDERMRADWVNEVVRDVRHKISMAAYNPKWEELKPGIVKYAGEMLTSFSDFLGGNKWFAGDNLTYTDFVMHELLYILVKVDSSILDGYKNLQGMKDRFEAIPAIAAYRETDLSKSFPIYAKTATFGGVVID
ncbi:glutathione S-transferase Mu 1-like isoform X3 [Ptychodera flava]|uniref:glutathione S-transferase Mu 1-like isoform X3 n=1 Tax=Ptychodera flava TaxID=63121 RepID=UPI00396A872C